MRMGVSFQIFDEDVNFLNDLRSKWDGRIGHPVGPVKKMGGRNKKVLKKALF
jgi:hypothetical protein